MKRLFSTSSSTSHPKGFSYENATSSRPPFRGTAPGDARGQNDVLPPENHVVEHRTRQFQAPNSSSTAAPPTTKSGQWDAHGRSQSLHRRPATTESKQPKPSGRTFSLSGFSMKSSRGLHSRSVSAKGPGEAYPLDSDAYAVPPMPKPFSKHSRNESSHVDLILASSLKQHASGKRDYGEDVADRNIEMNSRPDTDLDLNLSSPDFAYMRSVYLREKGLNGRSKSREHSRGNSAQEYVLKDEYSLYTMPHDSLDPIPIATTTISSDGRRPKLRSKKSSKRSLFEDQSSDPNYIFVSTTRKTSIVSTYQPSGKPYDSIPTYQPSGKPIPIPCLPNKPPVPTRSRARTLSMTSSFNDSRASTMRETMRDGSSVNKRGARTIDDFVIKNSTQGNSTAGWGTAREGSPLRKVVESPTATAAVAVTGKENSRSRTGSEAGTLGSGSTLEKKNPEPLTEQRPSTATNKKPLTPPTSPDTFQERDYTPIVTPKKDNLPKKPTPKKDNQSPTKPSSGTRSRANSAAYSPFPKTGIVRPSFSRQTSQMSSEMTKLALNDSTADTTSRAKSRSRAGSSANGKSEVTSLKGVVDLNDSVDIRVSKHTLPAVTHETIIPQVHIAQEERVTREIHTHDVFHRIQPIIDTKVLPTKHYVRNNAGGLTEIPASAVSDKPEDWQTERSYAASSASHYSDDAAPPAIRTDRTHKSPGSTHPSSVSDQMELTSTRTSTALSGAPRTEYIWRHPPTTGPIERSQSRPRTAAPQSSINRYDGASDSYDDYESESSQSRRSEDSSLLFRDTGYGGGVSGYGGMLPGLSQSSPVVNPLMLESEATKAARRRMAAMNFR